MISLYSTRAALSSFALLIIYAEIVTAQKSCPVGFFFQDGECLPCVPGFFRPSISIEFFPIPSRRCLPCPAGTFNPASAASTEVACRSCPVNTFSESGAAACTPCPPSLTSNRGATVCLACGPGTRFSLIETFRSRDRVNPSRCIGCQRGFFSTGKANLECTQCPEDHTGPPMATGKDMCRLCRPGTEAPEIFNGPCAPCIAGTFKAGRSGRCIECPPGTVSPRGSTSCTPCPKDTFSPLFGERCTPCPPGTTTPAERGIFCRAEGEPCPRKLFENPAGNCETCGLATFRNMTARTCQPCPPGSVSFGRLRTRCMACPPGSRALVERGICVCDDGMVLTRRGSCEKCPAGTFALTVFAGRRVGTGRLEVECMKCRRGTFQDEEGATECKPCPSDLVTTEEGATQCVQCPRGLTPSIGVSAVHMEDNIACVKPATACPPGFERDELEGFGDGDLRGCRRIACRADTPPEEIGKTCVPCRAGDFASKDSPFCLPCLLDEFSNCFECQKCPDGLFRDFDDGSKCSCSRFGFGIQDGVCKVCPPGSRTNPTTQKCELCPPGTFQPRARRSSCRRCSRGSIASRAGSTECEECLPGSFSSPFPRGLKCVFP